MGDLHRKEQVGSRFGNGAADRAAGVLQFQLRVSRDVDPVLLLVREAPLDAQQRVIQIVLQTVTTGPIRE